MASSACEVSTRRPRIGVTTYLETASWGVWSRPAAIVPQVYLDAVTRSGGLPVLLPPVATDASVLDVLEALLIVGGADLDPATYGAVPDAATEGTRPERDEHERRLFLAALDRTLPVLGVCRGAQLMTAALGGTLHQHLPDLLGHEGHRPEPTVFGTSRISTQPGSLAAQILGAETKVPCYHHQGLAEVATPLLATGWADDGLVESVELPGATWVLGVQWHPEENPDDLRLFEALVRAAVGF
ncbi:MAG TPA: gamma-glutamyl-gamma-aminobutyrate hydrolase family protein [Nocardioidaceae bacterium]|nr:gamma-glutamyl-gamma-aminobutyrate hydrolase family protein [Nocardioidaceae bacterium]